MDDVQKNCNKIHLTSLSGESCIEGEVSEEAFSGDRRKEALILYDIKAIFAERANTVDTGLVFKGHPILLGPHQGFPGMDPELDIKGKKADTDVLTRLDRFLKTYGTPTPWSKHYLKENGGVFITGATPEEEPEFCSGCGWEGRLNQLKADGACPDCGNVFPPKK